MRARLILIGAAVVIAATSGAAAWSVSKRSDPQTASVSAPIGTTTRGDLTVAFTATATDAQLHGFSDEMLAKPVKGEALIVSMNLDAVTRSVEIVVDAKGDGKAMDRLVAHLGRLSYVASVTRNT